MRNLIAVLALLQQAQVPAMRVNEIGDLPSNPQLQASGLIRQRTHPSEGDYLEVGPPVRFSAYEPEPLAHAALPGRHSDEIAHELGVAPPPRKESAP
jgi:crotonobetainyl-CoA:carnitine CoA-transferase CaiB-like acyl-CoA transferase